MVGQASSLSIRDDGQDARPTGNLRFGGVGDCLAGLAFTAMTIPRPHVIMGLISATIVQFRATEFWIEAHL
jgi:hypothetical protein